MENKIAIIGIIVKGNNSSAECINSVLHDYSQYIIGRLGLPYRTKGVYIISIAIDAPKEVVEELAQKIEEFEGVNAKTLYA
ncbi:MAG: hypothetical protein E7020_01800 [Alphaproteobacteria bacterium]|nr:hypothetical protein [Alphaproteobacteria bacterium]